MNGLALTHYVSDCPIATCHWSSEPLASREAAHEARRAHLSAHGHGDLVDYIAGLNTNIAQYERSARAV